MEKFIVTIDSDTRKFFKQYLNVIKPLLSPKISNGELNILGELLYFNHVYRDIDEKKRGILIFDYDNKMDIIDNLDIPFTSFRNALTSLRKKGYIVNNRLKKELVINPGEQILVGFKFNLNDRVETE